MTEVRTPDVKRFVYLAATLSALGGMLFGYDIGVISGAILFVKTDFNLSPFLEEIVVSSVLVGVFWLILSEIYPLAIRGRAMSVGTIVNWSANLIVAVSFLTVTQVLGKPMTFWTYGAVSIAAWCFALVMVPETKGRSLEPIEAHWRAGKQPREL
jgi:hypothetical protein